RYYLLAAHIDRSRTGTIRRIGTPEKRQSRCITQSKCREIFCHPGIGGDAHDIPGERDALDGPRGEVISGSEIVPCIQFHALRVLASPCTSECQPSTSEAIVSAHWVFSSPPR